MSEIINIENTGFATANTDIELMNQCDMVAVSERMLADVRDSLNSSTTLSIPIAQISMLGAGVSSLIPALRTITQTTTVGTQGLYQLANAGVGDTLKIAKNGNFWGAFKTAKGSSKFAQLQAAGPVSATSQIVTAISPATMMMAVALFSVEQQLGNIEEMKKQIISFLEIEKESEIEADVESLTSIISKYKHNWDNEHFISGNHKLVLDIKRTARKNMLAYQKKVNDVLDSKQLIIAQGKVNSTLNDLQKTFQYYRLSLYTYSLSSMIEIMLSGNFKEENVLSIKEEIDKKSLEYRESFTKCSEYLEKITSASIRNNVLKGVGTASKAVGKFIGNIPLVKEGQVDEFLQDSGEKIRENVKEVEENILNSFASISNPGTGMFIEKMNEMIQIYNHTSNICIDGKNIYLIAG